VPYWGYDPSGEHEAEVFVECEWTAMFIAESEFGEVAVASAATRAVAEGALEKLVALFPF